MRTLLTLSAIFILAITSCTKDARPADQESDDSIYLSKLLIKQSGFDTMIINYYYDNHKRLIKGESGNSREILVSTDIYYNGSETLPNKVITNSSDGLEMRNTYFFYNYENGRLVYDSSFTEGDNTSEMVNSFSYINNDVMETSTFQGRQEINIYNLTIVNGNYVKQINNDSSKTITVSYDNNPNPFYKSSEFHYPYLRSTGYGIYSKNNPVEVHETAPGINFHAKYTYEYNSNGYPKSVTQLNVNTGEIIDYTLTYTSL